MNILLRQTFRSTKKNSIVSLIKIVAYTIGFSVVFFAVAYSFNEINYNKSFVKNHDVFQLVHHNKNEDIYDSKFNIESSEILRTIPEVNTTTRINNNEKVITVDEKSFFWHKSIDTDANFFDVFSSYFLNGSQEQFTSTPNSIVITESLAKKLFNKENPVGKNLMIGNYGHMKASEISGVIKDWPAKSSIQADVIFHKTKIKNSDEVELFFSTNHRIKAPLLQKKLNKATTNKANEISGIQNKNDLALKIVPITNLHFLPSNYNLSLAYTRGDKTMIISILLLAFGVFLIIVINNTILNISSSSKRMKEMGIIKAFGAKPTQIFKALSLENTLFVFISVLLSVFVLMLFNEQVTSIFYSDWKAHEKAFTLFGIDKIYLLFFILIGIILFTIFSTSLISSILVYRLSTTEVLRLKNTKDSSSNFFTSSLIIFQLAISVILIVGVMAVHKQLSYIANKDKGYNLENVFTSQIQLNTNEELRRELLQHPDIEHVTFSWKPTDRYMENDIIFKLKEPDKQFNICKFYADYFYPETFGIELIKGRSFNPELNDKDANRIIVNEATARLMAIDNELPIETNLGTIIGIVKNFHTDNLKVKVSPIVMYLNFGGFISFKVKPIDHPNRVAADSSITSFLTKIFKKHGSNWYDMYTQTNFQLNQDNSVTIRSGLPEWDKWKRFGYKSDDKYEYTNDKKIAKIGLFLTILAIIVSALGLFSVSFYMSSLKTKEVGVRKVNGAKTTNVLVLFIKNYVIKTLLALIIAFPFAYYGVNKYYKTFAYHAEINLLIFIWSFLFTLCLVTLTVSWQSWRAASRNPVEALRYE